MCNHTAFAKAVVAAACTLAIAILIIGMGVNSTLAADPPLVPNFTPLTPALLITPVPYHHGKTRLVQAEDRRACAGRAQTCNAADGKGPCRSFPTLSSRVCCAGSCVPADNGLCRCF
jgi:hypothetical protein